MQNLRLHLTEIYTMARDRAARIAQKNKARYDRQVTASALEVGNRVLVRTVCIQGKHKILDRWETVVHVVVSTE